MITMYENEMIFIIAGWELKETHWILFQKDLLVFGKIKFLNAFIKNLFLNIFLLNFLFVDVNREDPSKTPDKEIVVKPFPYFLCSLNIQKLQKAWLGFLSKVSGQWYSLDQGT